MIMTTTRIEEEGIRSNFRYLMSALSGSEKLTEIEVTDETLVLGVTVL